MVTTVGTESDVKKLVTDFIQLERDAVDAYDTCIEKLDDPVNKERVTAFRADHHRHLTELQEMAARHGAEIPSDTSAKSMLTSGKVQLADMTGGDGAILKMMATNEDDTITAYDRGASNDAIPAADRQIFIRALEDERTHKAWMTEAADRM